MKYLRRFNESASQNYWELFKEKSPEDVKKVSSCVEDINDILLELKDAGFAIEDPLVEAGNYMWQIDGKVGEVSPLYFNGKITIPLIRDVIARLKKYIKNKDNYELGVDPYKWFITITLYIQYETS